MQAIYTPHHLTSHLLQELCSDSIRGQVAAVSFSITYVNVQKYLHGIMVFFMCLIAVREGQQFCAHYLCEMPLQQGRGAHASRQNSVCMQLLIY